MIPQVSMSWASKVTKCRYNCDKAIETATPVITVFFRNKDKTWTAKHGYHPACWIQNGLDHLKNNPFVMIPEKPILSDEDKKTRHQIIRKHASLKQRIGKLDNDNPKYHILVAKIEAQIAQLMVNIMSLGGVPTKWLNGKNR